MSSESAGGPPEQPDSGPQSPGGEGAGPQSPPGGPPPAGSGGPPPPPPPGPGPGAGPQSGPPPGGGPGWGAPQGGGGPGYAGPGYAGPPPGYATSGPMVGYGLPAHLQGRQFASWGARAGAWLVDLLIYIVGLVILGYLLNCFMMAREGANNGQTLGKQAVGITTVREDGQPWNFGTALLREFVIKFLLFGWVGGFFFIPWLVDYLWPLWDEKKQSLHDKLSTSYVVEA